MRKICVGRNLLGRICWQESVAENLMQDEVAKNLLAGIGCSESVGKKRLRRICWQQPVSKNLSVRNGWSEFVGKNRMVRKCW